MSATATVKGGLFAQFSSTLTQVRGYSYARTQAARLLNAKSLLGLRAKMLALNGVAFGAAGTADYTRVEANSEQGGVRALETQHLGTAATTAADITEITNTVLKYSAIKHIVSPPANLDGNPLGTR